jgi:HlyD family secretion protein
MNSLWSWAGRKHRSAHPWLEERSQLVYAIASLAFSTTLLIYVYTALYTWATTRFAFAGLVGFTMFSTITLRRTAGEYFTGLRALASRAAVRKIRNAGIAVAALVIMFVGRMGLRIPAEFRILAKSDLAVRSETAGTIVEMLVHEGSHVAKGEVLARLHDFDKQQRLSELSGNVESKKHELELLMAGARPEEIETKERQVATKRMEMENARRNQEQRNQLTQTLELKKSQLTLEKQTLARTQELVAGGLVPRADLEKAETAVTVREKDIGETEAALRVLTETADRESDLKTRELEAAQSDLKLLRAGSRPEQIRQTESDLAKLKQVREILAQELEKTDIVAPIDGIVTTPFVERKLNQHLDPGDELCRIADIAHVTVEMQVPEKEMADVHSGNPVTMRARSLPTTDLEGRVDFIAPIAQTIAGQQMVIVRSDLPNDDLRLKPEMTGNALIYCGDRRIIDLMTRRLIRWFRTEFWVLIPKP